MIRHTTRFASLLALLVLGLVLTAGPANAGIVWCRTDPGLLIGGREAHINIYSSPDMLTAATGPTQLVVTVPNGQEGQTKLLYLDNGFGQGYTLTVKKSSDLRGGSSGIDIIVEAYVPSLDGTLPVKVEVVPVDLGRGSASKTGTANEWITVKDQV